MEKGQIRKKIWDLMENSGIARFPRPVYGRFPNFEGAAQAAERLKELFAGHSGTESPFNQAG